WTPSASRSRKLRDPYPTPTSASQRSRQLRRSRWCSAHPHTRKRSDPRWLAGLAPPGRRRARLAIGRPTRSWYQETRSRPPLGCARIRLIQLQETQPTFGLETKFSCSSSVNEAKWRVKMVIYEDRSFGRRRG